MKYTYKAKFSDGSVLTQPADDSSRLRPGEKSSKFDYLEACKRAAPVTLTFSGAHEASIDFETGLFTIDGIMVAPGGDLSRWPDACWIEGDPAQGHYFRQILVNGHTLEQLGMAFCFGDDPKPGIKNYLALR